jgi:hypothetical protein
MIVLVIIFLEFSYSLKYYIAFYKIFIGTKDRRGHASMIIVSPDLMLRLRPILPTSCKLGYLPAW